MIIIDCAGRLHRLRKLEHVTVVAKLTCQYNGHFNYTYATPETSQRSPGNHLLIILFTSDRRRTLINYLIATQRQPLTTSSVRIAEGFSRLGIEASASFRSWTWSFHRLCRPLRHCRRILTCPCVCHEHEQCTQCSAALRRHIPINALNIAGRPHK